MEAACIALCIVLVVVARHGVKLCTGAESCNPLQLSPCANAITSSTATPSQTCCEKIKEQRPCLCNYIKNPNLQKFINTPNARKVAITYNLWHPVSTC